jgi:hypothetical protein
MRGSATTQPMISSSSGSDVSSGVERSTMRRSSATQTRLIGAAGCSALKKQANA